MRSALLLKRIIKLVKAVGSPYLLGSLLSNRILASAEHRRVLGDGLRTVVDIGANRGQFSLAVRQWAPQALVIAFEPLPDAAATYRNLFQGDSKVTLHQAAIGPRVGEATIHISEADDSSSLLPITILQEELYPGTAENHTETIRVGQLSDFISAGEIDSPSLLKLDVQGYELEVLRGCIDILQAFDTILVECSFMELYEGQAFAHQIIDFLNTKDFILHNVYNLEYTRQGEAIQGDFLFSQK